MHITYIKNKQCVNLNRPNFWSNPKSLKVCRYRWHTSAHINKWKPACNTNSRMIHERPKYQTWKCAQIERSGCLTKACVIMWKCSLISFRQYNRVDMKLTLCFMLKSIRLSKFDFLIFYAKKFSKKCIDFQKITTSKSIAFQRYCIFEKFVNFFFLMVYHQTLAVGYEKQLWCQIIDRVALFYDDCP